VITQRVSTGIEGLDEVLQGGFPKGSMILLGGNPGTGKTIFSAEFLYHGARDFFENGLYVSFSEGRDAFIANMSSLGLDFEKLEREGKFKILDLVTVKEAGLDTLMEMMTSDIDTLGVERLVIDSFTAMANAFAKPIDVRIALHLLSKIVRQSGCTTIVITEIPTGEQRIGLGIEEFVSDGIIVLEKRWVEGRLLRELVVEKMRGTRMARTRFLFTLHNGFKVFQPFKAGRVEEPRRFQPIPHTEERFSTGSEELDEIIGGLPRGSAVLIEFGTEISREASMLFSVPIMANFGTQGMAMIILPCSGFNAETIYEIAKEFQLTEEEINDLLRVVERLRPYLKRDVDYVFVPKGQDIREVYEGIARLRQELRERTGKPVLGFIGLDTAGIVLGEESLRNILDQIVTDTRIEGGLIVFVSKPGVEGIAQYVANMADIHVRVVCENGVILFYGVRPRTSLYVAEMDCSKGYPMPKFTPIL